MIKENDLEIEILLWSMNGFIVGQIHSNTERWQRLTLMMCGKWCQAQIF